MMCMNEAYTTRRRQEGMDADLLRKMLTAANQFDTGRVLYDGEQILISGDGSDDYEATVDTLEEVTERIRNAG